MPIFFNNISFRKIGWTILFSLAFGFFSILQSYGDQAGDPLTVEERTWLDQHNGKILISNELEWPPITFMDESGNTVGIAIDYYKLIEKKLGFTFKLDRPDTWINIIDKLYNKKIDVICDIQKNPERAKHFIFTQPYITIPTAIIVRKEISGELDLAKMGGMKIGAAAESHIFQFLKNNYNTLQIVPLKDPRTCLLETATKAVDAAVVNVAAASYIIEKEGITNLRVAGYTKHRYQLSFATRNDWPILAGILDKGLGLISPKEKGAIYRKWIHLEITPIYKRRSFWIIVSTIGASVSIIFLTILAVNRKLKGIVKRRTASLEQQTKALKAEIAVRRQTEKSLKERETQLRTLIETIPDLVWLKDVNGAYISCNLKFERFYGVKEADIIGKTDHELVNKELADFFSESDRAALTTGDLVVYEKEIQPAREWGGRLMETVKTPMYGSDGKIIGILGVSRDITERKKIEERAMQAQKMEALGTLAGGIAHDFNNILSSILGFTELAKMNTAEDQETQDNLNQVLNSGLRARELVKHILTFSRKASVQKDVLQITPLLKEDLRFLKAFIPPNIEMRTDFSVTDSAILADPTQMHQVFMNLFTNAAQAMKDKGGILDIRFKSVELLDGDQSYPKTLRPGKYVKLTISDTGCGIPPHLINKIFEPFFTTKPKGEGTGMGLSTAYGIIEAMQGHISVTSKQGVGTTFQILLPEQAGADVTDPAAMPENMRSGQGTILLVDDDSAVIRWTSKILLKLGYTVVAAENGPEALDKFKANPTGFDLVLTDLAMPKLSGLELSRSIKSERLDVPIVLCTGFSEGLTKEIIQNSGISEIILKPVIASELVQIIGSYLNPK